MYTAYVLDDEAAIGTIACRVLNTCGHLAYAFDEPHSFISKVQSCAPDLIMLDLALGRSDAIEVLRSLDELGYQGDILLMSGRDASVLAEITKIGEARGLTMLPPLRKPFTPSQLKDRLRCDKILPARATATTCLPQVDLSEAIEKGWLQLWYQPKIDLKKMVICGAEALLRISHPELGIVLPGQFLPKSGDPLFHPLSKFLVETAISDWKAMFAQGVAPEIAINVPVSVLLDATFVAHLRARLPVHTSFPGLIIEVTEDEMVQDEKAFREIAMQLKLSSVGLSIDDFGTAHASLARLKDLPFSEIKLDRSFVSNCSADANKRSICRIVADLAKQFKVTSCAEGVETAEDLEVLRAMGFDAVQGYLFAKAMPRDAFVTLAQSDCLNSFKKEFSDASSASVHRAHRPSALAAYSKEAADQGAHSPLTYYL